jgi:hypothetical protein
MAVAVQPFAGRMHGIGVRSGTGQPPYGVNERLGPIEVHKYGARLATEITAEHRDGRTGRLGDCRVYLEGVPRGSASHPPLSADANHRSQSARL